MLALKEKKMPGFIKNMFSLMRDNEEPYVRLAETEYSSEFRHLTKSLGRRPTNLEARSLVLSFSKKFF